MAKSAFRQALEDAIEQRHSAVHPWSEAWTAGKLDRRQLGEWVKQHFHYVSHFAEWVAAVYATCPHPEVQHFLLENVTEEEGLVGMHGAAPVRHSDLLLEFGEVCGQSRREIPKSQAQGRTAGRDARPEKLVHGAVTQAVRRGAVGPADRPGEP